jgi:hypothetical protein
MNLAQDVFLLQDCAGSVRLQAVQAVMGTRNWTAGLRVVGCADVALEHCTLAGSSIQPFDISSFTSGSPMPGLQCEQSVVALQQCTVDGGQGRDAFYQFWWPNPILHYARAGADACTVTSSSFVFAHGCAFRGGDGGDGEDGGCDVSSGLPTHGTAGAAAGNGLFVELGSSATELACGFAPGVAGLGGAGASFCGAQPGAPGAPGVPTSGTIASIADGALELDGPTHVRAGQPLQFTARGTPGDLVLLATSLQTRWVFDPLYEGVFLFGTSARRFVLGTMPGSGEFSFALPSGSLPPGMLALNRTFQIVTLSPSGQVELGGAAFVTILDPSF